jgi:hypothetical protein
VTPAEERRQADEIVAILQQRNKDGSFKYSNADVRHFLPFMILSTHVKIDAFPSVHSLMLEFFARLEQRPDADPETLERAVRRYYARNPLNAELYREFRRYCLGQAKCEINRSALQHYARLTSTAAAKTTPLAGLAPPGSF